MQFVFFIKLRIFWAIIIVIKNEVDNWGVAFMTVEEDA